MPSDVLNKALRTKHQELCIPFVSQWLVFLISQLQITHAAVESFAVEMQMIDLIER